MPETDIVRVLPPAEVEALLLELQALLSTLPNALPIMDVDRSIYGLLLGFTPDPELVEDRGEVGAVNTALERIFGHRKDGLKILERGKSIEAVVHVLERYLKQYPGDIILQKWLVDLVSSARLLRPKREIKLSEKKRLEDLKRRHESDTSTSTIEFGDSQSEASFSEASDSEPLTDPNTSPPRKQKNPRTGCRQPHGKPPRSKRPKRVRKSNKAVDGFDTIPTEHDDRFNDVIFTLPPTVTHGGAPRNKLVDRLVVACYLKDKPQDSKNHHFRCIASSLCGFKLRNMKRQIDRILKHSACCRVLRYWKPELFAEAEWAAAQRAPGAKLGAASSNSAKEDLPVALPEASEQRAAAVQAFFAPFNNQGKLDTESRINLAIVWLLCWSGVAPRIADSPDWAHLFQAVAPRLLGYSPPSSTTLRDKLIPAEARLAVLNMRRFLKTQRNLSLSFDGLTEGHQPVYTVHICTPDRQ
ncbi:hypothetical protein FRC06_010805, partial [Ceratobasidium sp. 370]